MKSRERLFLGLSLAFTVSMVVNHAICMLRNGISPQTSPVVLLGVSNLAVICLHTHFVRGMLALATFSIILSLLEQTMWRYAALTSFVSACIGLMIHLWPSNESNETADASHDPTPVNSNYQLLQDQEEETDEALDEENDEPQEPASRLQGTRRLLQLAAPQVVYLYSGCLVLLVRLPFSLSIPHFVSSTLAAAAAGDWEEARRHVGCILVLGTIDAALDFWCVFLFGLANQRIVKSLRTDLFRRLLGQEVAFFDKESSGTLTSRLTADCSAMASDLTWFFRFSIESVVRITGIAIYMVVRSPLLGGIALCMVPVVAAINKVYGDWLRKNAIAVQDALAEANAVAQEALVNVRTVISFAAEDREAAHYESKIERNYVLNVQQLFWTGVYYMSVSTFLINTVVQASLLWIGTTLMEHNDLSAQVLLAFMLYQGQLQNETLNLFQSYSSLIQSSGAGDKVFRLLDRHPPSPASNNPNVTFGEDNQDESEEDQPYKIELDSVSFAYPSRPDREILQKLSLSCEAGQTLALVGPSGCGKTTITQLLQRFYDVSEGKIRVNGKDLEQLDIMRHRRSTAVVSQDPILFQGSILDNITYGLEDPESVTLEHVREACRLAHAHQFIQEFTDGYLTAVGERGVQLSGGQKQRISIARALLIKPSLLLLDEATSALDTESEAAVQEALDELLCKRNGVRSMTTVVIAHRLLTVRNADKIAVINNGQVVEEGSHEALMKNKQGSYRKMVLQAGKPTSTLE